MLKILFIKYSLLPMLCVSLLPVTESKLFGDIPESSFKVMPPMNVIYHPVSTINEDAQKSFDRGLTYIFAFNHDIAFREFENASKSDPNLAMAYWGMALALGQNMNQDIDPEKEIVCFNYIQKSISLSKNASHWEQDYISALSIRYPDKSNADLVSLRFLYRNAMKKLMEAYPEDLDASTMYAESILNLDPWKWWTPDRKPKDGTIEAIDVLNSVLLRNPEHIGANHYYIHALEESPYPERALMSAHRLEYLLPESGHLLHMPCHIFLLVGDYESALRTGKKAIAQDKDYLRKYGIDSGHYPFHYLTHNLYVLTRTYMLMEDYPNAIDAAFEVSKFIESNWEMMPTMAAHLNIPLEIYLYFHKWDEILDFRLNSTNPLVRTYWHYSRAVAYASLGNLDAAQKEKELMMQSKRLITSQDTIANNPADKVMDFAGILLNAVLAKAKRRNRESIEYLRQAADLQDTFEYDEPPAWYVPARQLLGFELLRENEYSEAENAFRKTLIRFQRNGRSLFGLNLSLKGLNRPIEAYLVEREAVNALRYASKPLNIDD